MSLTHGSAGQWPECYLICCVLDDGTLRDALVSVNSCQCSDPFGALGTAVACLEAFFWTLNVNAFDTCRSEATSPLDSLRFTRLLLLTNPAELAGFAVWWSRRVTCSARVTSFSLSFLQGQSRQHFHLFFFRSRDVARISLEGAASSVRPHRKVLVALYPEPPCLGGGLFHVLPRRRVFRAPHVSSTSA